MLTRNIYLFISLTGYIHMVNMGRDSPPNGYDIYIYAGTWQININKINLNHQRVQVVVISSRLV